MKHPPPDAAAALARERDDAERARELEHELLAHRLAKRGAWLAPVSIHAVDARTIHDMVEAPSNLTHGADYVTFKRDVLLQKGSEIPLYLRASPEVVDAANKSRRDLLWQADHPSAAEIQAKVDARTKVLIGEVNKDAMEHAQHMAERWNSLDVLDEPSNMTRAVSVARHGLRKHTSLSAIRREAAEQIARGVPPRSETAAARLEAASGNGRLAASLTRSQVLQGKLELLDEELTAATTGRRSMFGHHHHHVGFGASTRSVHRHSHAHHPGMPSRAHTFAAKRHDAGSAHAGKPPLGSAASMTKPARMTVAKSAPVLPVRALSSKM